MNEWQDFTVLPRLASNSVSSYFSLMSPGIQGMYVQLFPAGEFLFWTKKKLFNSEFLLIMKT